MIARFRIWLKARRSRRLLAEIVRNADAALAARARGDDVAFKHHAARAKALSAKRDMAYRCPDCHTRYASPQLCGCGGEAFPVSNHAI